MRKIVAGLHVSLDGVTESPEKWTFQYFNDDVGQEVGSQMAESDAILLGRRTYEEFAAYWPDKSAADDPIADFLNNTPKYVASTTLESLGWQNSTLLQGDVADALAQLKNGPGKNITITGSVTLVGSLLSSGLIDELRLLLFPIVVGNGRRLFEDVREQVGLKLVESKAFGTGVVALTFEPAGI